MWFQIFMVLLLWHEVTRWTVELLHQCTGQTDKLCRSGSSHLLAFMSEQNSFYVCCQSFWALRPHSTETWLKLNEQKPLMSHLPGSLSLIWMHRRLTLPAMSITSSVSACKIQAYELVFNRSQCNIKWGNPDSLWLLSHCCSALVASAISARCCRETNLPPRCRTSPRRSAPRCHAGRWETPAASRHRRTHPPRPPLHHFSHHPSLLLKSVPESETYCKRHV